MADFGEVLETDRPREFEGYGRRIAGPDWPSKIGWSRCFWYLGSTSDISRLHPGLWPTRCGGRVLNGDYVRAPQAG